MLGYVHLYWDYIKYDPSFLNGFLGIILQAITLVIAWCALSQIGLMKKQDQYSVDRNKIDALERFQKLIEKANNLEIAIMTANNGKFLPEMEVQNYFLSDLNNKSVQAFSLWREFFSKNKELMKQAYDVANELELFAVSIQNKEIYESVKNMVAQSFCELVEKNPAIYIYARPKSDSSVHMRYENTISVRKMFLPEVGSIKEREALTQREIENFRKNAGR